MTGERTHGAIWTFLFEVVTPLLMVVVALTLGIGTAELLVDPDGGGILGVVAVAVFSLLFYGIAVLLYAGLQSIVES
ncbi:hypothetical protein [Haloarchaeobius sp. FL176]|uniref:hypothetical protein n=1 Tax=Haloarchaeobius sp. FL176 TaxID=2967129 RepID=UPI002148AF2D|nr:hypothetical protein [Haloarchaeobius sp. FL176]